MTTEGNGQRRTYRISISGAVAQQIKEVGRRAAESGRLEPFFDALRTVERRLRTEPLAFGELTADYHELNLIAHTGSVAPITVRFAIDEVHSIVHIREVILRAA
jgi:hypothetical protein